ncbi:unnamed protein product [Prunus brigantina]
MLRLSSANLPSSTSLFSLMIFSFIVLMVLVLNLRRSLLLFVPVTPLLHLKIFMICWLNMKLPSRVPTPLLPHLSSLPMSLKAPSKPTPTMVLAPTTPIKIVALPLL